MKRLIFTLLFVVLVLFAKAMAGVNLRNGNFYISYTDIVVPGGGEDLKILRTYNSKSTEVGWFGFGWGSEFETKLVVSADGSVIIHEHGSGARTRFIPKESVNAQMAVKKIIEAMRKKSTISDKVAANLTKKLLNDAELRQAYSRSLNVKAELAKGSVLYSKERGIQRLHKLGKGYKRVYNDGKSEFFDLQGKLVKITDKNGYTINLKYEKNRVKSIKDSRAKQLFFEWFPEGKVKYIWSSGEKKVIYKYQDDDLVHVQNIQDNIFKYKYDNNHNLTSIEYIDGSKLKIKYAPKTQFVSQVINRNGDKTVYKYESSSKDPQSHYWTLVTKHIGKSRPSTNKYEYQIKTRKDGSKYTYRILTVIDGVKTETVYSGLNSLPLKITRGNQSTTFEYNKKGLLTKKTSSSGEYVELEYHPKYNKITKVKDRSGWTTYKYDKKANLILAQNSNGTKVQLFYERGKITRMLDKSKGSKTRTLFFSYNSLGKPAIIRMKGVGEIKVKYDNYGEILNVESKKGHQMALQVTRAFQSLLSIVKPAGVNLNL